MSKRETVNPIDYFYPFRTDFNLFHQGSDHLPFGEPIRLLQAPFQELGKGLDLADDELEILLLVLRCGQDPDLIVEGLETFLGLPQPGFELRPIDQTLLIGIDQTAHTPLDLLEQGLQGGQTIVRIRLGPPAFVLAGDPLGLLEQGTDILPNGFFQPLGTHRLVPAEALSPKAGGVTADAPVVGVGSSLALGRLAVDRFSIVGVPTDPTDQQTLEQIPAFVPLLPLPPPILRQLFLHRLEEIRLHQGRDRNRDPLLGRDTVERVGVARLGGIAALGPQVGTPRAGTGLAVGGQAFVGGVLQQPPDGRVIPPGFARGGGNPLVFQPPADLPQGHPLLADPGKDLADHAGLFQHDLLGRVPSGHAGADVAVPVGSGGEHVDRAVPGRV